MVEVNLFHILIYMAVGFLAFTRGRTFIGYTLLSVFVHPLIIVVLLFCLDDLSPERWK